MIAVEVSGLTKDFGSFRAVDDLTFELPRGEVIGFVGPNGAGKFTTIRMLLGLIRPTSGTVFGESISNPPAYMDRVGALVESPTLYPQLSGYRNLLVLTRLADLPTSRIHEVLDVVKLTDRANDRYSDYSLGMKQRLGIAGGNDAVEYTAALALATMYGAIAWVVAAVVLQRRDIVD